MSKASPSSSRFARSAQTATIVPAGNSTPRCSTGRRQIRAVNGVIGSARSTSCDRRAGQLRPLPQQFPLVGMGGEHPQRVR